MRRRDVGRLGVSAGHHGAIISCFGAINGFILLQGGAAGHRARRSLPNLCARIAGGRSGV
jgi:hypothetical protein